MAGPARLRPTLRKPTIAAAMALLAGLAQGCVALPPAPGDDIAARPARADTRSPLDRAFARFDPRRADASGVALLPRAEAAFRWRHRLIALARRSVDLQTFEWHDDAASRRLETALLAAADRGVRVRILIDDFLFLMPPGAIARLSAHPNIAMRAFNPHRIRSPSRLVRLGSTLTEFRRLNRRMHAKSLVVDGTVAIVGGRNVSDRFAGRHRLGVFRDLEAAVAGPAVARIAEGFEAYWRNRRAVAARDLLVDPHDPALAAAAASRPAPAPAATGADLAAVRRLAARMAPAAARWVYDTPDKNAADTPGGAAGKRTGRTMRALLRAVRHARRSVQLASGYVFLTPAMEAALRGAVARGVAVTLVTGSLATTHQLHLFTCYARQRRRLLAAGIEIREYRADPAADIGAPARRHAGRKAEPEVAYHAKAAVFDGRHVFVGSLNLDARSAFDNMEAGLFAESPALAARLSRILRADAAPTNAWHLSATPKGLVWRTRRGGRWLTRRRDPGVGASRRVLARAARLLPVCGLI